MLRGILARIVIGVALLCASLAWSGWAYLHTVADPRRAEQVATAVLDDADARHELAGPLADQIVSQADLDPDTATVPVRTAVADVLADPRIADNVIDAIGSAHARSFGLADPRPATIDGALLLAAVREHLAPSGPGLAALIPTDVVGDLTIPERSVPFIAGLRSFASAATTRLALTSVTLFGAALFIGDRARTLRRVGRWAVAAGVCWAIGPRLIVAAAHRWLGGIDATLAAVVSSATSTVTAAATVLVLAGIGTLVAARLLRLAGEAKDARPSDDVRPARMAPRRPERKTAGAVRTSAAEAPTPTFTAVHARATAALPVTRSPAFAVESTSPPPASSPARVVPSADAVWDHFGSFSPPTPGQPQAQDGYGWQVSPGDPPHLPPHS